MFVSGPVGTSVTGAGWAVRVSRRSVSASRGSCGTVGSPWPKVGSQFGPSSPEPPWMFSATSGPPCGRACSGPAAPAAIGTSRIAAASHTRRALRVVFSSDWLPATVVIASRSTEGWAAASRMLKASS